MNNQDIRTKAKKAKVKLWKICDKLGISESTMTRKLRHELPDTEKQRIFAIIDEIAAQKENAAQSTTNTLNG